MLHRHQLTVLHGEHMVAGKDAIALGAHLPEPGGIVRRNVPGRNIPALVIHVGVQILGTLDEILQRQLGQLVEKL